MLPLMMEFELSDLSFFIKGIKYPGHFDIRHYVSFSSSSTRSGSFLKLCHKLAHRSSTRHFYFYRISRLWNALPMLNLDLSHSTLMRNFVIIFGLHVTLPVLITFCVHAINAHLFPLVFPFLCCSVFLFMLFGC